MSSNKIKFLSIDGLKHFTNNILSIIEDNEYVTATAITDLNERLLIVENNNSGSIITEADITAWGFTKNTGTITGVSANGTSVATSGVANIPAASTSAYGVTKLSSATNSTSTSLAATASAVKAAYDLANSYKGTITGVSANGTSVATSGVANIPAASTSAYGVTKLSSSTSSTSTSLAATASAVKAAYDLANSYKGTVTGITINSTTKNPTNGIINLGNIPTEDSINNILTIIEDNEYVTATAITDLDDRLKNHNHIFIPSGESTIPDEFENMTFEEILEMLYRGISANSEAITQHYNNVNDLFDEHLAGKIHLPEISNATVSNKVLFLQAVKDTSDTKSKPTWAELPVASSSVAGIITTGAQTIKGEKTLQGTLTLTPSTDDSGKETYAKFGTYASLAFDWTTSAVNLSFNKDLAFTSNTSGKGIYFNSTIHQTKFETKSVGSSATISITPGIITKIKLNYFETGSNLKLTLGTSGLSGSAMTTGMPYFGKCYITVSESLSADSTGLITLSAAKIPESIQYSKSSVIEVSITGFTGESTKYYSWRYIYV